MNCEVIGFVLIFWARVIGGIILDSTLISGIWSKKSGSSVQVGGFSDEDTFLWPSPSCC